MDPLCYLCVVFVMLSRLFIAALWPPEGKGLTSSSNGANKFRLKFGSLKLSLTNYTIGYF